MRSFQNTFETFKQSFISAFSICMTVPLNGYVYEFSVDYNIIDTCNIINIHK